MIRAIIITALALLVSADAVLARSIRFYNRDGIYQGRISSMGNVYNRNGVYAGRVRSR